MQHRFNNQLRPYHRLLVQHGILHGCLQPVVHSDTAAEGEVVNTDTYVELLHGGNVGCHTTTTFFLFLYPLALVLDLLKFVV